MRTCNYWCNRNWGEETCIVCDRADREQAVIDAAVAWYMTNEQLHRVAAVVDAARALAADYVACTDLNDLGGRMERVLRAVRALDGGEE